MCINLITSELNNNNNKNNIWQEQPEVAEREIRNSTAANAHAQMIPVCVYQMTLLKQWIYNEIGPI